MIDLSNTQWRKSRRSGGGNTCVELAATPPAHITVRDSTNPTGPKLTLSRAECATLFDTIKSGALDLR